MSLGVILMVCIKKEHWRENKMVNEMTRWQKKLHSYEFINISSNKSHEFAVHGKWTLPKSNKLLWPRTERKNINDDASIFPELHI